MAILAEVKAHAMALLARGDVPGALRLLDAVVAAAPLDYDARMRVADALAAAGQPAASVEVLRAVGWYVLEAGHPLVAVVVARVIESRGGQADDLLAALVVRYGSDSPLIGKFAGRINLPDGTTPVPLPDLAAPPPPDLLGDASDRARVATEGFDEFPAVVHPIPLLSALSEAAFRRVLATLVVRRLPDRTRVMSQGEPGRSFFFVAGGEVRVFATDPAGEETELARLHEGAVFGEMALLGARPRSASVETVGEADLLEVTRDSLASLAGELDQVAAALDAFTGERLVANLLATSPLFRPFSRAQQRDLLRRFTAHPVAAGTTIIAQGEEGRGLFLVLSGEVQVAGTAPDGAPAPLATLSAGDLFGEMSLVRGGPTSATVTATSPATVLFLERGHVERIAAAFPEIHSYLARLTDDRELDTRLSARATTAVEASEDGEDDVFILL